MKSILSKPGSNSKFNIDNIDFEKLSSVDKRMLQMFYITVWSKAIEDFSDEEVLSNLYSLSDSPIMKGELIELLEYKFNSIDFVDETKPFTSDPNFAIISEGKIRFVIIFII